MTLLQENNRHDKSLISIGKFSLIGEFFQRNESDGEYVRTCRLMIREFDENTLQENEEKGNGPGWMSTPGCTQQKKIRSTSIFEG